MSNPITDVYRGYVTAFFASGVIAKKLVKPGNVLIPGDRAWVEGLGCVQDKENFQDTDFPAMTLIPGSHTNMRQDSCGIFYDMILRWSIQVGREDQYDKVTDAIWEMLVFHYNASSTLSAMNLPVYAVDANQDAMAYSPVAMGVDGWGNYTDVRIAILINKGSLALPNVGVN